VAGKKESGIKENHLKRKFKIFENAAKSGSKKVQII
jgi:hypothetical protein